MQMFKAKILVAAVATMMILMPQFNEAGDEVLAEDTQANQPNGGGEVTNLPDIPDKANFLLEFCGSLVDGVLKRVKEDQRENRTAVYEAGIQTLTPIVKKKEPTAHEIMAQYWTEAREVIAEKKECTEDAGYKTAYLMVCADMGVLHKTMGVDVRQYSDKCSSSVALWEKMYDNIVGNPKYPKEAHEKLNKFINDEFIASYYKDNRAERVSLENPCCDTRKAWRQTFESFQTVALDVKNNPLALKQLEEDPDKIEEIYNEWVLRPCQAIFTPLHYYMGPLEKVSTIIPGGSDKFLSTLRKEIQDNVFRHRFCLNIIISADRLHEQKRSIAWNVLFPTQDYGRVNCYA